MCKKGAGAYPGAPVGLSGPVPPRAEGRLNAGAAAVGNPCLSNV